MEADMTSFPVKGQGSEGKQGSTVQTGPGYAAPRTGVTGACRSSSRASSHPWEGAGERSNKST